MNSHQTEETASASVGHARHMIMGEHNTITSQQSRLVKRLVMRERWDLGVLK